MLLPLACHSARRIRGPGTHTCVVEGSAAASQLLMQEGCWGHLLAEMIENCCWRDFWMDSHHLKG